MSHPVSLSVPSAFRRRGVMLTPSPPFLWCCGAKTKTKNKISWEGIVNRETSRRCVASSLSRSFNSLWLYYYARPNEWKWKSQTSILMHRKWIFSSLVQPGANCNGMLWLMRRCSFQPGFWQHLNTTFFIRSVILRCVFLEWLKIESPECTVP